MDRRSEGQKVIRTLAWLAEERVEYRMQNYNHLIIEQFLQSITPTLDPFKQDSEKPQKLL